jgi:hypothetical protein
MSILIPLLYWQAGTHNLLAELISDMQEMSR